VEAEPKAKVAKQDFDSFFKELTGQMPPS